MAHINNAHATTPNARLRILGTAVLVGAVALTGCGKIAEKATEKATEKVLESISGLEDVDIDTESGEMTIRDSDGKTHTYSNGEEGYTYSDSDGNETTIGGTETTVPDWFPSDIPLPDSYVVTSSTRSSDDDSTVLMVILDTKDSVADSFDDFKSGMTSNGWEVTFENRTDSQGNQQHLMGLERDGDAVSFAAMDGMQEEGSTMIQITVTLEDD